MSELEAIQLAIAVLRTEASLAEPQARDWREYGSALQSNRNESRLSAKYADQLTEAVTVLEALKARLHSTGEL
jgi:hypothetical protein